MGAIGCACRRGATVVFFLVVLGSAPVFAADAAEQISRMRAAMDAAIEEQAKEMVRQAPESERADIALAIGAIYEMGMMSEADAVKAAGYYTIASELDSPEADCALGLLYLKGATSASGQIPEDTAMAMEYFSRAAVGGSVKAMVELGKIHHEGLYGVPRDGKKALVYFMDAARRGSEEALTRLAPVMEQAKKWEEAKPGRKANFPTSREQLVNNELVKQSAARDTKLDKVASHTFVELGKKVATQMAGTSE